MVERPKPDTIVIINTDLNERLIKKGTLGIAVVHICNLPYEAQIINRWTYLLLEDGKTFLDVRYEYIDLL